MSCRCGWPGDSEINVSPASADHVVVARAGLSSLAARATIREKRKKGSRRTPAMALKMPRLDVGAIHNAIALCYFTNCEYRRAGLRLQAARAAHATGVAIQPGPS